MPHVQMPDGAVVDMPDSPTPDQLSRLRAIGSKPAPAKSDDILDKASYGIEAVTQPVISAATAVPAGLAGAAAGGLKTLTSGKFGTPEGIAEGEKTAQDVSRKFTYEPSNPSARKAMEYVQKLIDRSGIQGVNPAVATEAAPAMRAAGQYARTRASEVPGVVGKAVDETAAGDRPPGNPSVADPAGQVPGRLAARKEALDAEKLNLARKAVNDYGINLRPDMLSDNKFMRMIGEAFEKVPLAGSKDTQRQVAFNRGLIKLIGGDDNAQRLTPKVFDTAITKAGGKIGEISAAGPVNVDDVALARIVQEADRFSTADVAKVVKNYAEEIRTKVANGQMDGRAFKAINSKLGKQIRRSDGDMQFYLDDMQESMHDMLASSRTGPQLADLQEARKQYAIAKTLEPLVAKSKYGDVSPAGLMGQVTSTKDRKAMMARGRAGELGDLARIGQAFLKEPESSGTTERAAAYGVMAGGLWAEPTTATSVYGLANLYNRAGPSIAKRMLRVKDMPAEMRDTPISELGNE